MGGVNLYYGRNKQQNNPIVVDVGYILIVTVLQVGGEQGQDEPVGVFEHKECREDEQDVAECHYAA